MVIQDFILTALKCSLYIIWSFVYVLPCISSLEDPPTEQEESAGGETTYRESYDDITVNELLNHIPLVSLYHYH